MTLSSRLRLFGIIQDLQEEALELGMSRTAAALEATSAVVMDELSEHVPSSAASTIAAGESEEADPD